MKKNLLLTLSVILFLFSACKKEDQIVSPKQTKKTESTVFNEKESTISSDESEKEIITNQKENFIEEVTTSKKNSEAISEIDLLRKKHEQFLNNSPFNKVMTLSKADRKSAGLPPNKYYEQEWELSMNPQTGRPTIENLHALRKQIAEERAADLASGRTPGDASDNNWVERGPNNVGGRVRAVMFDPNDATFKTVFAGGVSGGLWKNTDITSSATVWTRVNIPDNLAVSSISV